MASLLVFSALLPAARAEAPPTAQAKSQPSAEENHLELVGGPSAVWLWLQKTAADDAPLYLTVRDKLDGGRFRVLPLGGLSGTPAMSAVSGKTLHIIFNQGDHIRYEPVEQSLQEPPDQVIFVERSLPEPLPRAFWADHKTGRLYALITARQADKLRERMTKEQSIREAFGEKTDAAPSPAGPDADPGKGADKKQTNKIDDQAEPAKPTAKKDSSPAGKADDDSAAKPALEFAPSNFQLAQYVAGKWSLDRPGPPGVSLKSTVWLAASRDGRIHLLFNDNKEGGGDGLQHWVLSGEGNPWQSAPAPPIDAESPCLAHGWRDETLSLLVRAKDENAGKELAVKTKDAPESLQLLEWNNDAWSAGPTLQNAPAQLQAAAYYGPSMLLVRLNEEDDYESGLWASKDGHNVEPFTIIEVLQPPLVPTWVWQAGEIIVLLGVFGVVFIWRRQSLLLPATLPPNHVLCTLPRRLVGFLLDVVIMAPLLLLAGNFYIPFESLVEALQAGMANGEPSALSLLSLLWATMLASYALVAELAWGTTLGKRIVGATVFTETGERPPVWSILVRNILRVPELAVPPILLLAVFTQNQQRLGDMLARTIVAMNTPPDWLEWQHSEGGDEAGPDQPPKPMRQNDPADPKPHDDDQDRLDESS